MSLFGLNVAGELLRDPLSGRPLGFDQLDAAQYAALLLAARGDEFALEVIDVSPDVDVQVVAGDAELCALVELIHAERELLRSRAAAAARLN